MDARSVMDARWVIDTLRGSRHLAQQLDTRHVVVYTWHRRNRIPGRWMDRVAAVAAREGLAHQINPATLLKAAAGSVGPHR